MTRVWRDFGYEGGYNPVDVPLLLTSSALQLVCELVLDVLCVWVEERLHAVAVVRAWDARFKGFTPVVWACGMVAFVLFNEGFSRLPWCPDDGGYFCACNQSYSAHQAYCDALNATANATLVGG